MNKHTEGPWRYSEVMNFSGTLVSYIMSENSQIAQTRGSDEEHTEEEITANAALLAAAPELVEALQGLMDAFIHTEGNKRGNQAKTDIIKYNQPHVSGALNRARHAIDKAEATP